MSTTLRPSDTPPLLRSRPQQIFLRQLYSRFVIAVTMLAAVVAVGALLAVLAYLLFNGFRSLTLALFTHDASFPSGGLRDSISGTLILLGLASAIGIPIGILGGVYQIESKSKFAFWVRFFTDVLNSIPSIVIGVFAYIVVVLPTHHFSAYAGGFALGILMIPTIMRTTEEILRLVPQALREGSLALGATRWRTMWHVVLPAARTGVITGVMLALARVAGETAPLVFTAFGNDVLTGHLNGAVNALPLVIYNKYTDPSPASFRTAMGAAIVLVTLICVMSLLTRYAVRSQVGEEK